MTDPLFYGILVLTGVAAVVLLVVGLSSLFDGIDDSDFC